MNNARPSFARRALNFGGLALVMLMWASQFPAYRVASEHMTVYALSAATFAFAILLLLPFLPAWKRRQAPRAQRPTATVIVVRFVVLAVLGILPPSILMAWGIEHSTASNGAILTLTQPVVMMMLAVPMLGEQLSGRRIGALVLALAGALCLSQRDLQGGSFTSAVLFGNAAILLACVGGSFYNIYSKRLLVDFSELEVLIYGYLAAGIACVALSLTLDHKPLEALLRTPWQAWVAVVVLATLTWGLSMVLFMWLLKRLDVAQVSVSIYLLSVFGVLLSALTLGERLTLTQVVGGGVVVVATLMAESIERRASAARHNDAG